ncbi:DUF2530 domain-containing protein [Kribbella sp. NPDC026596]|uniref:DUF2530 domain-containing protein n=1 Tax=Kribbella sp. NPDC026596 TaxID=3155122 RepID=UPI0033FE9005
MTEEQAAPKKRNDPTSQLARGELVHAEVKPLDLSGIPSVIVGIIGWAIAFVVVLIFRDELKKDGLEWWLWVTVAGFGLGLIGLWYCVRRWNAIKAGHRPETED